MPPPHLAAQHRHADAVRLLLDEGGRDVDPASSLRRTMNATPTAAAATGPRPHRASFLGGGGGTAAAGASWGNAVSGVGSRATDRDNMIDCLVAIDVITSNDAIANDDGGHDSDCWSPFLPHNR